LKDGELADGWRMAIFGDCEKEEKEGEGRETGWERI
jgi:hypothetical protein